MIPELKNLGFDQINYIDPTDNWLQKRILSACNENEIKSQQFNSPLFLNTKTQLYNFFREDKKKYHQTTFYKEQRKKHNILIDKEGHVKLTDFGLCKHAEIRPSRMTEINTKELSFNFNQLKSALDKKLGYKRTR